MQYGQIGNMKASKIILGTWQAGKKMWAGVNDRDTSVAIRTCLDLGINMIDTAAEYGDGHSEQIIGHALKDVAREKYYLATKVFADKLHYHDVLSECEKSLRNLNTDYIDLYQIHWPAGSFNSEVVPIQETMEALNILKNSGKILNIGTSNFSRDQLQDAMQYGEIISNQPPYSLIWRAPDKEINPFCRSHNLAILSYSPLAQGILTGKFHSGHQFPPGDHRSHNKFMQPEVFAKVEIVLQKLQPYADEYNTSIGNVALNWLISQPQTFAISGVRNVEQITQNVACCDFQLSSQELQEIDTISEIVTQHMDQSGKLWDW